MKSLNHFAKRILVVVYIACMVAMIGCVPKQDIIHSNIGGSQHSVKHSQEFIPEMGTPLAAPKMPSSNDVETVTLVCEFQEN